MSPCLNSPTGRCQRTAPCEHACGLRIGAAPTVVTPGVVRINGHRYTRPTMKVAKVTVDGATCVVPLADLCDLIEGGGEYTVRVETMGVGEFARLAEFAGW